MIPRRNVLIFHSGALGDFILTWPLAVALGRLLPQSRLFYVTHAEKGKLAEKALGVESVGSESGWHALFMDADPDAVAAALTPTATRLLAGAQWIFSFVAGPDSTWMRNVARLAPGASAVSLSQAPPDAFGAHMSDFLVEQLAPWAPWREGVSQILRSIAQRGLAQRAAAHRDAGPTLIHPGSGSPHKCWPADSFLELAHQLSAAGDRPVILLGDVEAERWAAARADAFARVGDVRRPVSLVELYDVCAGARRFIGNDSGPTHLAAIIGVPTLAIFGPTDPARWRPLGPAVRVLRRMPMHALGVPEVLAAASALAPG